ncbi:unnamed protein product [Rotaria sp. Silwood1]|nr:unnamed protein product [Rotaria sp. Silwood1]CAF4955149.1 unnamed protein product [Rotaria sp. Silwood1]
MRNDDMDDTDEDELYYDKSLKDEDGSNAFQLCVKQSILDKILIDIKLLSNCRMPHFNISQSVLILIKTFLFIFRYL